MSAPELRDKAFFTVKEAAEILRINPSTLYASLREDAFPAVKLRSRFVIPGKALEKLIDEATNSGRVIDPATLIRERRDARYAERIASPWT
jgi:excisionase family DNA binding protein